MTTGRRPVIGAEGEPRPTTRRREDTHSLGLGTWHLLSGSPARGRTSGLASTAVDAH